MSEYTQGARYGAAPTAFAAAALGPMFEAATRTGNAYGKACLAWQDELLRFTSTRLQRDAEFGSNLLKCDKWADAARLQQSWVASAVEDYVSEANRLLELATNLTTDVARNSSEQAREVGEGVRRYGSAVGDQASALAEGVSRFTRSAGEQGGAVAEEMRRSAESAGQQAAALATESRKAAEEMAASARDRGQSQKRR